ncbi:MAG TPA: hypothetical protein V6C58_12110 [Allocoleopsis sp.]
MSDITPTKQIKITAWQDSLNAVIKQLKIAQSLQMEALNILKESPNLDIEDRAKTLTNITLALSKSQDMENQCYDRLVHLRNNYPY